MGNSACVLCKGNGRNASLEPAKARTRSREDAKLSGSEMDTHPLHYESPEQASEAQLKLSEANSSQKRTNIIK